MNSERLDVVIFGASGFTGKFTIFEGVKLLRGFKWGIAGRNKKKLEEVLAEIGEKANENLSKTPIIIADVDDEKSLFAMATQAKVIINCCGPFRLWGEQVVKACIKAKTHHIDVSGEPLFMEKMQLKYNEQARDSGVYVVTGCGFDSIPADLGVVYLESNFSGTLNSVDVYTKSYTLNKTKPKGAIIHFGTYASACHAIGDFGELRNIRRKLFAKHMPKFKPTVKTRILHTSENSRGLWCLPILEMDQAVVERSQRYFYETEKKRPVQMRAYGVFGSFFFTFCAIFGFAFFAALAFFTWTRKILLAHPKFFTGGMISHEGPRDETSKNAVVALTFSGEGWSEKLNDVEINKPIDKKVVTKVTCPNPGYGTTCICLLIAATCILRESSKMPEQGGVFTPAAAFKNTKMIQELHKNGVTFEVIKS
jgi:short subunit dehydrogenase-like uncharacterized protein